MVYLVCFCIALVLLLFIVAYEKSVDINIILLICIVAVGNGGYYAMANSTNLSEAILGNNVAYVVSIFAPLTLFNIICVICRLHVRKLYTTIMYAIQIVIYLCVCTAGKYDIFYKTVEFHRRGNFSYLTKTYGPMHSVFLVSLLIYTLAGIVAAAYSLGKKTVVSRINVDIILFLDMLVVGVYVIERFVKLDYELIPIFLTFAVVIILIPLLKVSFFSARNNVDLFDDSFRRTGYIVFNRRLKYMGCNEYAAVLFPELNNWELEKKIPANGGRFNTFLRQPLLRFVEGDDRDNKEVKTYEYKDFVYSYEIRPLTMDARLTIGYVILISDITDVVKDTKK